MLRKVIIQLIILAIIMILAFFFYNSLKKEKISINENFKIDEINTNKLSDEKSNLLENISLGIDMFDCVMPTRNARNGMLFTSEGTINITNKKWEKDFSFLDSNGTSYVDKTYTKAYVRHLFKSNELLGKQIATLHNIRFYLWLMNQAREKIKDGTFTSWKNNIIKKLDIRL